LDDETIRIFMTYQQFKDKWLGKGIDWDNHFGFQCVDVYRQYCHEVLEIPQSPLVKGAKNIWTTYLKEHFKQVPNTPEGVPQQGDIVIWDVGTYGHVGICDHATVSTVTCFEQNWLGGGTRPAEIRRHGYKDVLGWLVYNKPEDDMAENLIIKFLKEKDKYTEGDVREMYGAWQDLGNVKELLEASQTLVKSLEIRIKELGDEVKAEKEKVKNWHLLSSSATKRAEKAEGKLEAETKQKNNYKRWYEKSLENDADKMGAGELFKLLLLKLGLWPKKSN